MPKGSHSKFFPGKLMLMLDQVDSLGLSHGASWVSEGRAFAIHDPDLFMTEIAPQFFDKQTHLRSFHRQLSIWGFTRLETGAGGRGVWFHKNFVRGNPDLIKNIKRVPVKNPKPTSSNVPKNSLPDYTNYQLPVAVGNQEPAKLAAPAPGQVTAASLAAANGGLPPAASLPGQLPPEYLAALGRMPPTMAASYPAAAAPGFPPSMLPYYQHPSIAASLAAGGLPPSAGAPAGVGDVAAQLQNLRAQQAAGQAAAAAPQAGGDANLNAAILSMIMDSRGGAAAAAPGAAAAAAAGLPPGADVRQDLLSAIAKRNNLLAQVSTQEAAATSPKKEA
ncbi:hypothetical protein ACHAXT_008134 [Thalassiosira profunda]